MKREAQQSTRIDVWYSNQLERLAERMILNLNKTAESAVSRLFGMPTIIVPNQNIATYLKYEIARGHGIAAGLKFKMTHEFLGDLLGQASGESPAKLVGIDTMRALFIDVLSDEPTGAEPLPEAVQAYLAAGGRDRGACDLRRFQLGSRLAGLARQYGNYRPEWLRDWADGRANLEGDPLAGTEEWQRGLWVRLIKRVRAQSESGANWVLPFEIFGVLEKAGCKVPGEIHLFGFSYVWHGLRDLIVYLSQSSRVDIYTLAPFMPFATDRTARGTGELPVASDGLSRPRKRPVPAAERGIAASRGESSLVDQWGRPGREYFEMLARIPGVEFHPSFVGLKAAATTLGRLQREILQNAFEGDEPFERDSSLTIFGCASVRREAEWIANEIWRLIREDNRLQGGRRSAERLRFRDIGVLVADTAKRPIYQAHIRAVFEEIHRIPYNIIDLPLAGECRVIEALLLLLALPLGEFTRPELLKILTHPAVRARFPEANVDRWRDWCLDLEIVRGADGQDHAGTYIDQELFHWEQGLKRLVLGAFMAGPQSGDDRAYQLGAARYLPYDRPAGALADVGRLLGLLRSLVADARFAHSAQLTMTEWSAFFARLVKSYLAADSDSEERAFSQCVQQIEHLQSLDVGGRKVGYRIACESLREALLDLTGARGHYLADGVVVSPLLEMRSLPFRVVFLCGLGEGRFPAVDGPDPLDLTLVRRESGDVSPRERDKYLFLETLACARERLYLSYVARDAQTGDDLAPSTLVHELLRHLERGRTADPIKTWVAQQPLRRFAESYFERTAIITAGEAGRASFLAAAEEEYRAGLLRISLRAHCTRTPRLGSEALRKLDRSVVGWLGLCPIPEPRGEIADRVAVSSRDLLAFLKCPLQGWASLKLRLRQDGQEDEEAREDEPFVSGPMGETTLLREVFFDALAQGQRAPTTADLERLYDVYTESRARRGVIPIGLFGKAERRRHLDCLETWNSAARKLDLIDRCQFHIYRIGRAREVERVDRLESPIILHVPLGDGARPVRVELHGRTELVEAERPASITPVVRDTCTEKDFLAGFLDAVILSLLPGHHGSNDYHAQVIPGSDGADLAKAHRVFHGIDAARAREFLTNLLADLLGGPHAYLLPCEAVFDYLTRERSIGSSVEEMKENESKACSSRFGPVPHFEDYEPLSEDEARAVIERRFGLFRDAGGLTR